MEYKKDKIEEILSLWGFKENINIKEEDIIYETNREPHIWTVNEDYILKMNNNENEVINNIYISNLLSNVNIPAQKIVYKLDGKSYAVVEGKCYVLFTKLKGNVLKDYYEGDYIKRGIYLGKCIAILHEGLGKITNELKENNKVWDNNMIDELSGWVSEAIDTYIHKCNLPREEVETLNNIKVEMDKTFEELYTKLPRQVIHRDMHGENMIFQENELVGYIDFDLTQINARIFDICYICTGSLVAVFDNLEVRERGISFAKSIIEGYESKCKLTTEEKMSVKYMLYAIELIMIAFFAKDSYTELADTNIRMVNWISSIWDS